MQFFNLHLIKLKYPLKNNFNWTCIYLFKIRIRSEPDKKEEIQIRTWVRIPNSYHVRVWILRGSDPNLIRFRSLLSVVFFAKKLALIMSGLTLGWQSKNFVKSSLEPCSITNPILLGKMLRRWWCFIRKCSVRHGVLNNNIFKNNLSIPSTDI